METFKEQSGKNGRKRIIRSCALLFSFVVLITFGVMANSANTGNTLPASKDDEKAIVAAAHHQELMNYIYMTLGFGVILGVAWFTVAGKKKRKNTAEGEKSHVIKHQHSTYEKRYGSGRSHGIRN